MSRPTYQLTQEQLDALLDLQQQRQARGRRLSWRERLTGRVAEAKLKQTEHTYAGPYKSWDPLRFIQDYHPDDLDYDTLEWLEDFYAVRPSLMFIIATILSAVKEAAIECDDPDIVAFLQELVKPLLLDLCEKSFKALVYGVSFNEIIREGEDVEVEREDDETGESQAAYKGWALLPKEVRHNYVATITDVWKDENGHLAGYTQDRTTDVGLAEPGSTSWCFVYSVNDESNPVWGKPELRLVYSLAYWLNTFISLAMRRGEKEAGGALIGFAPIGSSDVEGEQVDNLTHMANILSRLQDNFITVFPWQVDPITKGQMWGFNEVALSERSEVAMKMIEYLGKWIFLTLLVPPDVLEVASKPHGSRSAVETLFDAFLIRMQGLGDRWAMQVEAQLLNPLAKEHFGAQAPKVRLTLLLSEAQKAVIREVFTNLLTTHQDVGRLDLTQMAEDLGVPVKSSEEIEATAPPERPEQERLPKPEGEEEEEFPTPEPALTLELEPGKPWDKLVEEARLLLDVGLPEDTRVVIRR